MSVGNEVMLGQERGHRLPKSHLAVRVLACRGVRSIQKRECEMVAYFWLRDEVADAIIH